MHWLDEIYWAADEIRGRVASHEPPGDWNVAETVLAMGIALYGDPSRLGGTKRTAAGEARQHPAVIAAARAIGRSDGAVVLKVMNLRSALTGGQRGMAHGSKTDRRVVQEFGARPANLVTGLSVIGNRLPGAEEVFQLLCGPGPGRMAADEPLPDIADSLGGGPTTRLVEVAVRRGQGPFRGRVLANYEYACAFCGLRSRHPDRNTYLLIASHILPWKDASDHQRLDPTNGFSLCAIHDRAFEWGFLAVDDELRILVSDGANEHYEPEVRVRSEIEELRGRQLVRSPRSNYLPPKPEYLAYHRQRIFDRRFRDAG